MAGHIPTFELYGERNAESGTFWLHCETIPERSRLHGWEIDPHRHERFFQIFHISRSSGEALIDGSYQPFAAPAALFIPPRAVHGFRFAHDVDGHVLTAVADRLSGPARSNAAIASFAERIAIVPLAEGSSAEELAGTMQRIDAEMSGQEPGRTVLLEALVVSLIIAVARAGGASERTREHGGERVARLHELIAAHFREHRKIGFYADALGVSEAHLNRVCRATLGRSIRQLLDDRLMEAAIRDLVFTPTPVQAIAFSLGFSDPAYFNRFFRRHKNTTPGAFRASERANPDRHMAFST